MINKYIKYKKKYLNLKNKLKGGGEKRKRDFDIDNNRYVKYYIQSEIMYNTNKILFDSRIQNFINSNDFLLNLFNRLNISYKINNSSFSKYLQDPIIVFKQIRGNQYAYIKVAECSYDYINFLHNDLEITDNNVNIQLNGNGNDYGGNFISSPPINNTNGYVFYFAGISELLKEKLAETLAQELVELNCSFKCDNERHIDEAMTFMPYGINKFKIWFYQPNKIIFNQTLIDILYNEHRSLNYINNLNEERYNEILDDEIIDLKDIHDFAKNKIEARNKLIKDLKNKKFPSITMKYINKFNFKTKELFSKIKYIYNDLIIQKLISNEQLLAIDPNITQDQFINRLQQICLEKLQNECLQNLNIISNKLFNNLYHNVSNNFVLFPIDLGVDLNSEENLNFIYSKPPVFNRLWIETQEECFFIRSNSEGNEETDQIVNNELPNIKSYLYELKPIHYLNVNTIEYHTDGNCGGNLHCLIKQIL